MPAIKTGAESKSTFKDLFRKSFFLVVELFSLFIVVLSLLTLFGSTCRVFELLTHLRVQLLIALIALIPALFFFKSRVVLSLVVVALCVHLFDIAPLYWKASRPAHLAPAATLRILTANVNTWNEKFADVQKLIESEGPDVVCLQELAPTMAASLQANLRDYPYRFVDARDGNFGIGIFSKFPMTDKRTLKLCPDDIVTLSATIKVQGMDIQLINTHPIAPLNDLFYGWRNQQLDGLADLAAENNSPVILAGDLNVSCFSPFFKRLLSKGHLSDSEVGFGVQPSWSAQWWPLNAPFDCVLFRLPLDHVLVRGPIITVDRWLLKPIGSDHLPLLVKLEFSPTEFYR